MSTREFAAKYVEAEDAAFQRGDFGALSKIEDPKLVMHMGPLGEFVGHEAHKQYILAARSSCTDLKQEWQYLAGDGNVFAMSYKSSARFVADMPGFPPVVGKIGTSDYLFVLRVESQRVVEVWAHGTMAFK